MRKHALLVLGAFLAGMCSCVAAPATATGRQAGGSDVHLIITPGEDTIVIQHRGKTVCCCTKACAQAFLDKPEAFAKGLREVTAVVRGRETRCLVSKQCLEALGGQGRVFCKVKPDEHEWWRRAGAGE